MANEKRCDLIDRQALGLGRCDPDAFPIQNRGYVAGWNGVINLIEQAPTVDAVEVVRCKDCKYRYTAKSGLILCTQHITMTPKDNDFCSYGERR